jgi:chemotaxis protein histidine kinase CheA/ActR/RegA family two-component response regulator
MEQHDRILGYFLEEASEHLNTIEQGLRKLPETVKQPTMIRELFRAAHSIKGSAAMLGLLNVQKISNQFEANFRLLKEQPQIAVDRQLQSLFLESFGFLQAGINDVRIASDPYHPDPALGDPIGDPVFEELKAYLHHLVATAESVATTAPERSITQDPAVEQVFGEYVTRKLDEIISLCLQPDCPEIRTQIQQICQKLGNLGENFEFLEWTNLFTACRLAIANPINLLPKLGESISIAVKQAQVLVLADRHQAIGITPDLEALIAGGNRTTKSSSPTSSNPSTWKFDDISDPLVAGMANGDSDPTQKLPDLVSINEAQVAPVNEFQSLSATSPSTSTPIAVEFDADAMELDEFMNLLSDDVPIEGTWMQDDDFLGGDLPLLELGDSATDKFYSQMFEPISQPAVDAVTTPVMAIDLSQPGAIELPSDADTYAEETFYTPDLGDLQEGDLPSFWLDSELAAQPQPGFVDLDLDRQLQPDLLPALEPIEIAAPDFSLDAAPMSGLFATAPKPEDWLELENLAPISSELAPTAASIDLDLLGVNELSEIEQIGDAVDLQSPAIDANDDLVSADFTNLDLPNQQPNQVPNEISASASDLLFLEELAQIQSPSSDIFGLADLTEDELPESMLAKDQITTELSNWIDNSIEQSSFDDLGELDFDILDREPLTDTALHNNSGNLDLARSLDPALVDHEPSGSVLEALDLDIIDPEPLADTALHPNSGNLDLARSLGTALGEDDPIDDGFGALDFTVANDRSLTDLDLSDFNIVEPVTNLSIDNNLLDFSSAQNLDLDNNFRDLNFNLDQNGVEQLDLNLQNFDESDLNLSLDNSSIDSNELDTGFIFDDVTTTAAFDRLSPNLDELLDSELLDPAGLTDRGADLDLNLLAEPSLDADGSPALNFEDLNFNLDEFSADLSDRELTLDGLELSGVNTPDLGNLDALLGLAAGVGIGSAIAIDTQSEFNDLDALIGAARPDNLDSLDSLDALLTPVPVAAPPAPNPRESKERKSKQSRTFEQTMKVSVKYLDNLNNLVGELVVNRNTLEQDQNRMRQFVEKLLSEVQKLNEVGKRMQDLYERSLMENSLAASRQQSKPTTPNSQASNPDLLNAGTLMEYDPLEMDRFTPIHLLSQKMIELTVRVRESTADIEFVVDGSTEVTRTLRQITGQLQEDLTKSRMVPFAQTADRLQRGVRDNGLKYGKQIELSVEGRDTLIDKVILESLTDPLIHMVNNAIAHGIESAQSRQTIGKSIEGKITIRALHQGNQTIISISDDGAGVDTERVKAKAIEKGLITVQQAATMSKSEAYELLFLAGFSTKDQADELSGRGVGMDVVKTSITDIRGTISTDSQLGVGTTFTIRLPLALSIAKALIAINNKNTIAFPMDGIEDTQDVSPEQIQTNSEGKQCIFWRDELMPFTPLSDLLGFNRPLARNNFYATNEDDSDLVSILILRSDGNFTAVQVDKITGDQEIVIKPLQGPAAKPLGIAGATVMGDGRIVPIADVMELIALANGTLARHVSTQWTAQMSAPTVEIRESMVLIVDDSITVRELLSLTFKRAGYRVEQARDGQEAWDKLRAGLPCDIVFCDIEMPRMDGLEFLSRIQKDAALSKVPVAMLTSRGSDRHRQIASQLGASGYFIKPYLEEALLEAAKRMIGGEVLEIV